MPVNDRLEKSDALYLSLPVDTDDRLKTIVEWTLQNLLAPCGYAITTTSSGGAANRITYAPIDPKDGSLWLAANPAMFERIQGSESLERQDYSEIQVRGITLPAIPASTTHIDLILTAFLFLSGYDEHSSVRRDRHGRYTFKGSLFEELGCGRIPVVDYIRLYLIDELRQVGVDIDLPGGWAVCPTVDVDYVKKWRPGIIYRELIEHPLLNIRREGVGRRAGRLVEAMQQFVVNHNVYKRSLEELRTVVEQHGGTATYFLKTGARAPYDVAYKINGYVRKFITDAIGAGSEIGLHPSYWAARDVAQLDSEIEALESATGVQLRTLRTHYLRWSPQTQGDVSRSSAVIDSTLGFPDTVGFRRGTCHPFRLFDFDSWRAADLIELPLIVMDSAVFNRMNLTVQQAVDETIEILNHCQAVSGFAVILWHNIILDKLDCPGWDVHFRQVMEYAATSGARIETVFSAGQYRLGEIA